MRKYVEAKQVLLRTEAGNTVPTTSSGIRSDPQRNTAVHDVASRARVESWPNLCRGNV